MSQVSRLCLGTASFGLRGYPPGVADSPSPDEAIEMLRYAAAHGVSSFDTSLDYGQADDLCLEALGSSAPVVTKTIVRVAHLVVQDDHWRTLLLHNPTLDQLRERPVPGIAGVSVYTPDEAWQAIRIGYRVLQVPYHVLNQSHLKAGVFEVARAVAATVYARQPFARGELLRRPDVGAICAAYAITPVEAALWFALESPADYVVFGVDNLNQLQQNIALAAGGPLEGWPECYQQLRAAFADSALDLASVCTRR